MMNKNRAVLYLRLSKEDIDKIYKGDDSESIVNQRLLLTDYAIEKEFEIVDVYTDDDFSGLYDNRPDFERLIRDSKLGKFDIVITKSQSRFTRNMEHMEKYLHHDFPLLGIRFIGIVDGVDTSVKGNKKARQIYGLTNEWYCEDLSENIRTVFKQKMKAGQFLGAFAPYGYLKSHEDKHKFMIDEAAAQTVRRIFDLYVQGYSAKRICNILEDDKIPNPTIYKQQQGLHYANAKAEKFSMKYYFWSVTTVNRILRNRTYIGVLEQGMSQKLSYKDKKVVAVPKENWVVVENHHAPIIEKPLFEKVQQLKCKRRVVCSNQLGDKKAHVFAGKLRCSTCGSTMIKSGGVRGVKGDWYLRCQLANKSRLKECTSHNIRFSVIEKTVLANIQELVESILNSTVEREEILTLLSENSNHKTQWKEKERTLGDLQLSRDNSSKALRLAYEDRIKGILTEEMFLQFKESFQAENEKVESKISQLENEIEYLAKEQDSKANTDELIHKHCDCSRLTHEIVANFIHYIEIEEKNKDKSQKIIIHWNI